MNGEVGSPTKADFGESGPLLLADEYARLLLSPSMLSSSSPAHFQPTTETLLLERSSSDSGSTGQALAYTSCMSTPAGSTMAMPCCDACTKPVGNRLGQVHKYTPSCGGPVSNSVLRSQRLVSKTKRRKRSGCGAPAHGSKRITRIKIANGSVSANGPWRRQRRSHTTQRSTPTNFSPCTVGYNLATSILINTG